MCVCPPGFQVTEDMIWLVFNHLLKSEDRFRARVPTAVPSNASTVEVPPATKGD